MNPIFYSIHVLASTYNCGTYGAGTYNDGTGSCYTGTDGGGSGSGAGSSGGLLAGTGMDVYIPLAGGILLVAAAITLLINTLKRRKK